MKFSIMESSTSTLTNSSDHSSGSNSTDNSITNSSHNSADGSHKTSQNINNNNNNNNNEHNVNNNSLFSDQVNTVTNLFEKWNDCERTVVMYALLKRMRYSSLKFLQYSIDSTLTQNLGSQPNLSTVVDDMNANNVSYLQNLLNAYKTQRLLQQLNDGVDALSSSSSDKDSIFCYGSDFNLTPQCEERKLYSKKEEILHDVLNMLPLLKPGNDEAKMVYLALIPVAVKDTLRQLVPAELVQQIFSYLLIHPAISNDDRRSLNVWLRHLEEHIQKCATAAQQQNNNNNNNNNNTNNNNTSNASNTSSISNISNKYYLPTTPSAHMGSNLKVENSSMSMSNSSTSSAFSSVSGSSSSNISGSSSLGNLAPVTGATTRSADWQTIAPPSKQHNVQHQQQRSMSHDWSSILAKPNSVSNGSRASIGGITDHLCDNLNGITLNELASSQNSLGLSLSNNLLAETRSEEASLVNGVAAAAVASASASASTAPNIFGSNTNPIISIISSGTNNTGNSVNASSNITGDDHDTSFSKNGTEILDFDPNTNLSACHSNNNNSQQNHSANCSMQQSQFPHLGYASILMSNCDQFDINRWSVDGKMGALKTRRSNSLTTQTISSSSSSNSSVITVNDNCSNSTENLAQFANKPRSFSLSIEHQRGALTNSGSDTRLDDFKPSYIRFQSRNVGMSNIGLWLKSLRLHKYIDIFKNITYEEMLQITEDYLQSLGVTKGASHKLALCIEKLKERAQHLSQMEQDLLSGQMKLPNAVEELANMVLTPMKPIEAVHTGEENVALRFLKVVDLACTMVQKDPYTQDDEHVNVIMWILERSIHNEAFVNQANQLKELKCKLSKLKVSLVPKMHHMKSSSGGNLNKPRWSGKSRKSDSKNGSNDRINHRKNSNDMLNFLPGCMQQQHHHHNHQQQGGDYEKYHHMIHNGNGSGSGQHQYKSSSYPSFMQQGKQQQHHHHQQQPPQQQMLQQHSHFSALPTQQQQQQHRRSLNNLILVSGGPQQPQKMIFKPGHGMIPASTSSADNLQIESPLKSQQQQLQQQQRKASLTGLNSGGSSNGSLSTTFAAAVSNATNIESTQKQQQQQPQQQQQQQQQPKKTVAAVVMVSNDEHMVGQHIVHQQQQQQQHPQQQQQPQQSHLLMNNNNSNMLNNNLLCQQQQQQLQLLAAAAAAVGNSCRSNNMLSCLCNGSSNSGNNSSNNNNVCNNTNNNNSSISISGSGSNCNNCCSRLAAAYETSATNTATPLITNINLPLVKEKYHMMAQPSAVAAAMNDIKSLEQLETLCLQMTEQAIN